MSKWITRVGAVVAIAAFTATAAFAGPDKDKKKGAAPTCEACKMPLSAKKDKTHTVAVKVGKKTYYCCDKCPMKAGKGKAKK